jgi:hypothetical protein
MFDPGADQAAGLRAGSHRDGAAMMPVASPAQPARAYELLCHLSAQLRAAGRCPVILDGTATEAAARHGQDGSHLGLQHALTDPSISGLGHPGEGHDWLVMPAAQGLRTLRQTALAAGGAVAASRLLSPFEPATVLLMFAQPHELAPLLNGLEARVMVPVLALPQAGLDAYGAVKLLHMAGLVPVLAPIHTSTAELSLDQVVASVCDCAVRHLGLDLERWAEPVWATAVQEHAQRRPQRMDVFHGLRDPRLAGAVSPLSGMAPTLWS